MYIQVKSGAQREIISQPLYDTVVANAVTVATYFNVPIGGVKTITETNMVNAGQLPRPQTFHVTSVSFSANAAAGAVSTPVILGPVFNDGSLTFQVGSKTMLQGILAWFVAGFGTTASGSAAAASEVANNGLPGHINKWPMKYRIVLDVNENFGITANWVTATGANIDTKIHLDGYLVRSIQ